MSGDTCKQRTIRQNSSLHLLFRQIALELNERGMGQRVVVDLLSNYATVPWSERTVKVIIWHTLQKAVLLKESTTQLTTKEVDEVFEVMNREIFVPMGIELPFPSILEVMLQNKYVDKPNNKQQ